MIEPSLNPSLASETNPKSVRKAAGILPADRKGSQTRHRVTGQRIRDHMRLAVEPCVPCEAGDQACWVGANSNKCAFCAETGRTVAECVVDCDRYDEMERIATDEQRSVSCPRPRK